MAVTRGTSRPRRALAASRLLLRTICPSKYSPVQGRKGVPGPAASGQGRGHAEGSPEKSVFSSGSSWTAASGAGDSDRERALPPPQRLAWIHYTPEMIYDQVNGSSHGKKHGDEKKDKGTIRKIVIRPCQL
ncbi:dexamethasone-induced protein isoform X2 [Heliangelus exortis]|uniref:dexamethasone-induced protein isoform X2 n=1 Tax=Heliangelus exortis TaxID=472823 RepID=UPI003A903AB9